MYIRLNYVFVKTHISEKEKKRKYNYLA